MSKEDARVLVELVRNKDEQVAPIMEGWNERDMKGSVERLGAAARKAGWDVANDELVEGFLGAMELSDEELDAVSGGELGASGHGGCSTNFYKERCTSTVEEGSWCGRNDWCYLFHVEYYPAPDTKFPVGGG